MEYVSSTPVDALTEAEAKEELLRLAGALGAANAAYHGADAPEISDATYDEMKRRNAAIEARFPTLKRSDSPSGQVGYTASDTFGKVRHEVRMLSLGNAFTDEDVSEFEDIIPQSVTYELKLPSEIDGDVNPEHVYSSG